MPIRLDTRDADFAKRFSAFLGAKREAAQDVEEAVKAIIGAVVERGDAALVELSRKFDRVDLARAGPRVGKPEVEAVAASCDRAALDALKLARERIEAYH